MAKAPPFGNKPPSSNAREDEKGGGKRPAYQGTKTSKPSSCPQCGGSKFSPKNVCLKCGFQVK